MSVQKDGCYPRVNGGMIQTNQYNGMIVSVVGKLINHNTLQTADGTNITLSTENIIDGLVVNPDLCIELIGSVADATSVTVSARRISCHPQLDVFHSPTFLFIPGLCLTKPFYRHGFEPLQSND